MTTTPVECCEEVDVSVEAVTVFVSVSPSVDVDVEAVGPQGPPGMPGIQGPAGPEGPAGGGTQQSTWAWVAAATTTAQLTTGQVGVNNDAPVSATQVRMHKVGKLAGIDWSVTVSNMKAGDHLYLQAKADATSFHRYTLTGAPTMDVNNWLIPVTSDSGSPQGTEPVDGADVLMAFQFQPTVTALQTRQTTSITTISATNGANVAGSITLSKGYRLLKIQTDKASRVRLYTTDAKRDADLTRPAGTDPTGDHGLLFDFVTTAGLLTADLSPTVDGFDGKTTPDGMIPFTITNLSGATGTVAATFTWIATE